MKPVPNEALLQEQLQHILGLYLEELFDGPPEEQPTTEVSAEMEEAEVAPEPVGQKMPPECPPESHESSAQSESASERSSSNGNCCMLLALVAGRVQTKRTIRQDALAGHSNTL
ncbi:hypothetical protein UY3_01423 [Chelonia mydas]|uniref:Uncharacterized protein n=1 Tax=Chelonia mydas TaxID=8469 RepID=M7BU30_CHEMY|nr:hypothetical protein UY3_01423 [Chelonia mydas]